MNRPLRRSQSSFVYFRKRVPADVLRLARGQPIIFTFPAERLGEPEVRSRATIGNEVKFSLQTRDPVLATHRNALATAQFEKMCAAIRNGPRPLTHKTRLALAGELYRRLERAFDEDPVDVEWWRIVQEIGMYASEGGTATLLIGDEARAAARRRLLERYIGPWVDAVLNSEAVVTDAASRAQLLKEGARALQQIGARLERNAEGDYRPDPLADRFPRWVNSRESIQQGTSSVLTFDDLFEKWRKERKPSASTVMSWRPCIRSLQDHIGHNDPARVTRADIVSWKDALVDAGRSPKGIKNGPLAAVRSLFNYAVDNGLLTSNPALGVSIRVSRKAGTGRLPYTDEEVARLLALADGETHSARRWLPWLLAFSGARVGELAQLWGRRVIDCEGVPVIRIAPAEDGGSLKNEGSERYVPIHPALIQRGFLDFVKAKGDGPLFYGRSQKRPTSPHERRHASKGVANHFATWIRKQGFTDKRKAPSHAFRHWFKTACQFAGVQDSIADAIQGHRGSRGEADGYRHAGVAVMAEAVRRIPIPKLKS